MNNQQVAHVWAQQNTAQGDGSNFYFRGATIYSYGDHFPLAKFVTPDVVLFNSGSYSVSTSKHQSYARNALAGYITVFEVPEVDLRPYKSTEADFIKERYGDMHNTNLKHLKSEAERSSLKASKARVYKDVHEADVLRYVEQYNLYLKVFKIRRKELEVPNLEALQKARDNELKNRRAKEAKRKAEVLRDFAEGAELWRAGAGVNLPYNYPVMVRIYPSDSEQLQTSQGATFPVEHARKAFPLIKRCRDKKQSWKRNGHSIHLGHFQLDSIDRQGNLKAGCHNVTWKEIERAWELINV